MTAQHVGDGVFVEWPHDGTFTISCGREQVRDIPVRVITQLLETLKSVQKDDA